MHFECKFQAANTEPFQFSIDRHFQILDFESWSNRDLQEILHVDQLIGSAYEIDEKTKLPEYRYIIQWLAAKRSAESQPNALQLVQVGPSIITKEAVSNVADSEIKRTTAAGLQLSTAFN